MANLEQIRAARAIEAATSLKSKAATKLPALILNNGLLAAAAFTLDESRADMRKVMAVIATHLKLQHHFQSGQAANTPSDQVREMIQQLSNARSLSLQRATDEALAYLGYLKRFAGSD